MVHGVTYYGRTSHNSFQIVSFSSVEIFDKTVIKIINFFLKNLQIN